MDNSSSAAERLYRVSSSYNALILPHTDSRLSEILFTVHRRVKIQFEGYTPPHWQEQFATARGRRRIQHTYSTRAQRIFRPGITHDSYHIWGCSSLLYWKSHAVARMGQLFEPYVVGFQTRHFIVPCLQTYWRVKFRNMAFQKIAVVKACYGTDGAGTQTIMRKIWLANIVATYSSTPMDRHFRKDMLERAIAAVTAASCSATALVYLTARPLPSAASAATFTVYCRTVLAVAAVLSGRCPSRRFCR